MSPVVNCVNQSLIDYKLVLMDPGIVFGFLIVAHSFIMSMQSHLKLSCMVIVY